MGNKSELPVKQVQNRFDPKNREVILQQRGYNEFRVTKPRTGFESPWVTKAIALKIFNVKIHCSQN